MDDEMILTDDGGFQIDEDSTWHVLAGTSLAEECVERIVAPANRFITGHLSVWLDAMLQTIKLPACIANLNASLAHVHGDTLTLKDEKGEMNIALLPRFG